MDKKTKSDIEETITEFPCLDIQENGESVSLSGRLISKEHLGRLFLTVEEAKAKEDLIEVVVGIPKDYKKTGCSVIDKNRIIDWSNMPDEHVHKNVIGDLEILCTHLPDEVQDMKNPILENVRTAYVLYNEYKRYLSTGKYDLKEYSHGNKGREEFRRNKTRQW